MASKLNKDDPEVQISALIYAMGKEAEHIFKSLQFAEAGDEKKFEKVQLMLHLRITFDNFADIFLICLN